MFFRDHDHSLKSKRRQAMEENEELNHLREEANLEKGDVPALIIAAYHSRNCISLLSDINVHLRLDT